MKKNTFLKTCIFPAAILLGTANIQAQIELKVLTETGTRFNDVNDSGFGVNVYSYYDFETNQLTPIEQEVFMVQATNNDENVVGTMIYDEPNFILQPGYRVGGTWNAIDFLPEQDPENMDENTVYGISPNNKYITGQLNIGSDYGGFLFDTETQEMIATFDPEGEAGSFYNVNDNGIMVGWVNRPNPGTLRIPAYRTLDGEYHLIPEGQSPSFNLNTINDINSSNQMAGDFNGQPFIYDMSTNTFTRYEIPAGADYATFGSISENGVAVGYANIDIEIRDAIVYHPSLGDQPLYLKDVLAANGVAVNTDDGLLGTASSISPNGEYIVGYLNGPPTWEQGWMVYLDDLILGTNNVSENAVSFYPNPVTDVLHINSNQTIDSVAVYTITGQRVSNITSNNNNKELNISNLASGVYLVKVTRNGSVENLKVVKQ
ncbi:T9SS type A sorting domain-containing protein [Aequorivita capsosiphonis]|uniref:T9SS type A sorting domain-containing protein n=1 Tax=Aequorivita capsosiphonis TaxID=487317 RepID=UPI00040DB60C|nr:T9SS type A sorting domain-containing protein [Aequorivita capsosiphonis]